MDKHDESAESAYATNEELPNSIPETSPLKRQSWIEVLVDPKTLQGLMACGGGLLVLGLVTWLWSIGVFENKLVVASCLGVANFSLLAVGVVGTKLTRYQTASKGITMLACLVMPLNLWFYDAQGLITLDQGGHLWVPALVCCALYALVARVLADPKFVYAIVGGVTMTGLLTLADHQVGRLWEIMAPSSFLVVLGMICIHIERAFPPEAGPFSRANFGRAFFQAGHIVMGLGLTVLLGGRLVGRFYEPFFADFSWLALPEVATQANLKLMAIVLALGAAYSYVYSQLVVQAKGRYLLSAALTLVWSAIMLLDLLQVAFTAELVMLLTAIGGLAASTLLFGSERDGTVDSKGDFSATKLFGSLLDPMRLQAASWAKGFSVVTLGIGLLLYGFARIEFLHVLRSYDFSPMYVVASVLGVVACWLTFRSEQSAGLAESSSPFWLAGIALAWLTVDASISLLGFELTLVTFALEAIVPLALAIASLRMSMPVRRRLALASELLATLLFAAGVGTALELVRGTVSGAPHLISTIYFAEIAVCLGLASRVSLRLMPAIIAAVSLCIATWQLFLLLGVSQYVFVLAMTSVGLVLLAINRSIRQSGDLPSQFDIVSQWTGRICISLGSVATLLIALARLLTSETEWALFGLLIAHVVAGVVAGLLAKESVWRRHFWVLATAQVLMTLLVVNALSVLSFWQRGEVLLTVAGSIALAVGFWGWSRETDREENFVSFNLALGSFLSAVPLTLGMLVQRFDNQVADWGWRLAHEGGVLGIGLVLLGAGLLCRIRWSTIVGGGTLVVYIVSLIGLVRLPEQLQTTAIYMMVGGGLFFGVAVLLSVYRDRLLSIPRRMQAGEGVFRVLKWR